jgi:hypothetical protein
MQTMEHDKKLPIDKSDFTINSLDDELRVDALCRDLLQKFYAHLLDTQVPPTEASALASSADYYIRDFVIDKKQRNILDERSGIVRQFAGTWYILNTLEPNMKELSCHLGGILAFYRFLYGNGSVSANFLDVVEKECNDIAYYEGRIASFWKIRGDGYFAWEKECTFKDN